MKAPRMPTPKASTFRTNHQSRVTAALESLAETAEGMRADQAELDDFISGLECQRPAAKAM